MFNLASLVSLALVGMPAIAAAVTPNAVGTLGCRRRAHTDNFVQHLPSGALLGLGQADGRVAVTNKGGNTGVSFDFYQCDSGFMGYKSNSQTVYGQIRAPGVDRCVVTSSRPANASSTTDFLIAPCSYSDDSSQLFGTFALTKSSGNANAKVTFVNGRTLGNNKQSGAEYAYSTTADEKQYLLGRGIGPNPSYLEFRDFTAINGA